MSNPVNFPSFVLQFPQHLTHERGAASGLPAAVFFKPRLSFFYILVNDLGAPTFLPSSLPSFHLHFYSCLCYFRFYFRLILRILRQWLVVALLFSLQECEELKMFYLTLQMASDFSSVQYD